MIEVPENAAAAPCMKGKPERFLQFALLCGQTAVKAGVFFSTSGIPARLRRGQVVMSYPEIAALWGVTESSARRSLVAFEKDDLIRMWNGSAAQVEGEAAPVSSLITVVGLADEA